MVPRRASVLMLITLGEQHRRQRKMLNPLFSAKHLRGMTPIFTNIGHKVSGSGPHLAVTPINMSYD